MSSRRRSLILGAIASTAIAALTVVLGLSYVGVLTSDKTVTAHLLTTGDSLGVGSDVKFRGLRVGRVLSVESGVAPAAHLVLMKEFADEIPADVRARVLPGTLFGNEYVDLVPPGHTTSGQTVGGHIAGGATIPADDSADTARLMDTFSATQRLLAAVDPARLDAAVSALADALAGRGEDLRTLIDDATGLMAAWRRNEPTFYRDLDLITTNARQFSAIEPDLVAALNNSLPLAKTVADREKQVDALLTRGAALLDDMTIWMGTNADPFATVLRGTAATLAVFAERAGSFELLMRKLPHVLSNGAADVDGNVVRMDGALAPSFPDPYTAADCPRYGPLRGKNCGDR